MTAKSLLTSLSVVIVTALTMVGCRSAKTASTDTVSGSGASTPGKEMTTAERYSALVDSYKEWATVSVPVKIELESPQRFSISGKAYMARDKSVLISLRMLGLEVATVYVDNDSLFITEKLHKYYFAEDVKSLLGGYPLTVGDLQSLLLGQAFVAGRGRVTAKEVNEMYLADAPVSGTWTMTPPSPADGIDYTFSIGDRDNSLQRLTVTLEDYLPTTVGYTDPAQSPAGVVSCRLDIASHAAKAKVNAAMKWNFKGAEWNSEDMRQWKRPKGYTRLKRNEALNLLSAF